MLPDKVLGFLVGFPLGAVLAWVWYELPWHARGVVLDEHTDGNRTWVRCSRCQWESQFTTTTVAGAIAYRVRLIRSHAHCAPNNDDRGEVHAADR